MLFLKRAIASLLVIIAVLFAVSFLLPRQVQVQRSVTIDAMPEAVFPFVNALEEHTKWSPWLDRDPDAVLTYSGPPNGVGNTLEWRSDHPQVGNGKQIISTSELNKRVVTDLDFGDMGAALAEISLSSAGTGTLVTWSFQTDMGMNPMKRWMGLMMDRWVGGAYDQGLSNLKTLIEKS